MPLNEARKRSRRQRSLDSSSGSDTDDGHDVGDSAGEMTISPLDQESRRRFLVHAGLLDTDSEASDGSEASENSNDRAFIGTYSDSDCTKGDIIVFVVHALLIRTFMIPCPLVYRRFVFFCCVALEPQFETPSPTPAAGIADTPRVGDGNFPRVLFRESKDTVRRTR